MQSFEDNEDRKWQVAVTVTTSRRTKALGEQITVSVTAKLFVFGQWAEVTA